MVLFRGCPQAEIVLALHRSGTLIGLALSSDELASTGKLDAYCYAFVGTRSRAASVFAQAAADLRRSSWSIDVGARLPQITKNSLAAKREAIEQPA